jgi:hypothetical protein
MVVAALPMLPTLLLLPLLFLVLLLLPHPASFVY